MMIDKIPTKTLEDIIENQFRSKNCMKDYWDYKEEINRVIIERKEREQIVNENKYIQLLK